MTVAQTGDVGSTVVRSYTGASDTGHLVGTVPSGKVKAINHTDRHHICMYVLYVNAVQLSIFMAHMCVLNYQYLMGT